MNLYSSEEIVSSSLSPNTQNLLNLTKQLLVDFADTNSIKLPKLDLIRKDSRLAYHVGTCGFYRSRNIVVAPQLCARSNPMYSWPSYISDRTIYGVLPHEFGHYVDDIKSTRFGDYSNHVFSKTREKRITSYSPNNQEWFAEMFRLFITNPDLLRVIRPLVYETLCQDFAPIEQRKFKKVLSSFNAPERIYQRLESFKQKS